MNNEINLDDLLESSTANRVSSLLTALRAPESELEAECGVEPTGRLYWHDEIDGEEIIELYEKIGSARKVGESFGVSKTAILLFLRAHYKDRFEAVSAKRALTTTDKSSNRYIDIIAAFKEYQRCGTYEAVSEIFKIGKNKLAELLNNSSEVAKLRHDAIHFNQYEVIESYKALRNARAVSNIYKVDRAIIIEILTTHKVDMSKAKQAKVSVNKVKQDKILRIPKTFNLDEAFKTYQRVQNIGMTADLHGVDRHMMSKYLKSHFGIKKAADKLPHDNPRELLDAYARLARVKDVAKLYGVSDTTMFNFIKRHKNKEMNNV